jgi:hypothetical protein
MNIETVEKIYDIYTNTFSVYKLTYANGIICNVPLNEANTDYQAIQTWIADGGTVIDNPPE